MIKTALGSQVMKDRSVSLTPQQRSALIMVDGKRSIEEIVKMTAAVGVTTKDTDILLSLGLIGMNEVGSYASTDTAIAASITGSAASAGIEAAESVAIDFQTALNMAITLCSDLGFKGFSLNMALTGVDTLEKLQKMAPEIRKSAGEKKYALLHPYIFGKTL